LMVNVAASDGEAHTPVGMDEETFNELQLRDLERLDQENRVMLHISGQKHFNSKNRTNGHSAARKVDHGTVLRNLKEDIGSQNRLPTELSQDDEPQASIATKNVMKTVRTRVVLSLSDVNLDSGLSAATKDSAAMTHSTTVEFLHYFWTVFLSGDPRRADELGHLARTLQNSLDRVEAVAVEAEKVRSEQLAEQQKLQESYYQQARKRRKIDMSKVSGGRKAVEEMLAATTRAVKYAMAEYSRLLRDQSSQQVSAVS